MALLIEHDRLVAEKIALQGDLPIAGLPRLADIVVSTTGEIRYQLYSDIDRLLRPNVRLILEGTLEILCQRCMMPMFFQVSIDTKLTIFSSDAEIDAAERDNPDIEGVVIVGDLDVVELIEEELILSVPYVATHIECESDANVAHIDKINPWSKLASLKK